MFYIEMYKVAVSSSNPKYGGQVRVFWGYNSDERGRSRLNFDDARLFDTVEGAIYEAENLALLFDLDCIVREVI